MLKFAKKMSHFSKTNFLLTRYCCVVVGRDKKNAENKNKIIYVVFWVSWLTMLFRVNSLIYIIWFMQPVKKLHGFARSEHILMDLANESAL